MKVIVCGGRCFDDRRSLYAFLDSLEGAAQIVHGGARGADSLAGQWAADRGVPCQVFPADWQRYGKAAGMLRNFEMAKAGADLLVAFPGGRGTSHMIATCQRLSIPVVCACWPETLP